VSSPSIHHPPVFCAIVDSVYFVGAVALVNSLRLTGHTGEIAFLDVGLDEGQRAFLGKEATVHDGPIASGWLSVFAKPMLGLLNPDRVVVLLDNDLMITGSLEPLVRAAEDGAIAVIKDTDPTRWFAEWEQLFSLQQPLRRGFYANGSCIALSTGRWRGFLERWYELGESIAAARASRPFLLRQQEAVSDPVGFNEQDTLNALLMSEVPESALRYWAHSLTPNWDERHDVRVTDSRELLCEARGQACLFLHCSGQPKPWQARGWLRSRFRAFNCLLTCVLAERGAPLPLPPEQIPPWLRPGIRGRLLEHSGAAVARMAYGSLSIVPLEVRTRFTAAIRARLSGTGPRA
jgi:hypothetical protein